jgi:putative DNA primase/helicase
VSAETIADHLDRAAAVRRALENGTPLAESGVSADELKAMATVEDKLAFASPITPGQKIEVQRERATRLREAESHKLAKLWRLLAEDYEREGGSQRVVLRQGVKWHGEIQDRVEIHYRAAFKPPPAPTLVIDADLDPTIAGKVLPLDAVTSIPAWLQAEVVQVVDTACSKRKLLGRAKAPAEELRRAEGRRAQVQALAAREAAQGRKVLVVATKAVTESLVLPEGCQVIHFGALRGLDGFKGFDTIIVAGREQPPPADMENQARAWFGDDEAPLALSGTYRKRKGTIRLADGTGVEVDVLGHVDPRVQALLEQVREREIEQAVGRLRLVWRTKPARVFLLSNTPTRLTVDHPVTWDALMPDRLEQAIRRTGGVLPLSASELARVFPDLWPSREAVLKSLQRREAGKGGQTLIGTFYWEMSTLSEATAVAYRRPGQRRGSPHRAVLPGRVEDAVAAEAALAAVLGPVEQVQALELLRRPCADEATPPGVAP